MSQSAFRSVPLYTAADLDPVAASFTLPTGACDCHAHVFGTGSRLVGNRTYTPVDADLASYRRMMKTLGLSRSVVVQPSVYGTDNRATLDAVSEGGSDFRAVVVVDEDVSIAQLNQYHAKGARGVRVNALFQSDVRQNNLEQLARTLADAGMHLQILTDITKFERLSSFVRSLPVPVVFDHFGLFSTSFGVNDPGFQALLALVGEGSAWVKLSGSYRITAQKLPPYTDVAPFAKALIRANPERLLWASDWPHPHISIPMPNDGALLDMLADWASVESIRNRILVNNPAELYEFELPSPEV